MPPWGRVRPSTTDLADDDGGSPERIAAVGDHGGWREGLRTVLDHCEGDSCCRSLVALPQVGRGCAGSGDRWNLTKCGAWPAAWCISCGRCPRGEELWRGVVVVETAGEMAGLGLVRGCASRRRQWIVGFLAWACIYRDRGKEREGGTGERGKREREGRTPVVEVVGDMGAIEREMEDMGKMKRERTCVSWGRRR